MAAHFAVRGDRRVHALGDEYAEGCGVEAAASELIQTERRRPAGCEHDREAVLSLDDSRLSHVVARLAAVARLGFRESSVIYTSHGHDRAHRRSADGQLQRSAGL